jgi:hypothetical protein
MAATKAWIVLTQADVLPYCVDDQKNRLTAINEGGEDPFGAVMPDVAAEVRTAIASNPANTLSATANAVPPELKRTMIWLLIETLAVQFSNGAPLTPAQQVQVDAAHVLLERVGNWKLDQRNVNGSPFSISLPDDPEVGGSAQSARPTATMISTDPDADTDTIYYGAGPNQEINIAGRQQTRRTMRGL